MIKATLVGPVPGAGAHLSHFRQFEFSEDVVVGGRLPDVANAHGAVFLQGRHVRPVLHTLALLGEGGDTQLCNYPSCPCHKLPRASPRSRATHLAPLHLFGGHDDDPGVLLKHHPPEVADGVLQAALGGDVALLPLGVVALHVQLRLHAE